MTYEDYIKNPMGKKNAVFAQRDMYYNHYSKKFDTVLVRENGKVTFYPFTDEKHDKYYLHIKIPSEVIANFYYDIVVEFYSTNALKKGIQTLSGYDVRFYSNDPSFVFTFAHAFVKNDMFIKELKDKMTKKAMTDVAKVRNPKDDIGYVKSLFFAYLTIKKYGLLEKSKYVGHPTIDFKKLSGVIMHADKKIFLRQEAQIQYNKMANIEKRKQQNADKSSDDIKDIVTNKAKADSLKNVIKKARTTKTVNKISSIKKANKTTRKRR